MTLAFSSPTSPGWQWDHSYAQLPAEFFRFTTPVPVCAPQLVVLNRPLAISLGLDPELLENSAVFAGNEIPQGSMPLAQAYAGHQFGNFTNLGDGRAILLGEHLTPAGKRFDIQLKGSGRTPYSRGGDGRAALGPMLREYIISEAMHALGIPTTRSLAVATTGEHVPRMEMLDGAVLTRVAASHIRVGTFQYAAALQDPALLKALADFTLQRHFPELMDADAPYRELFKSIMERQAALIARWLHVGFIHGVMNTDNMALSGETIDYGPCAFMNDYDPDTVFSSIDRQGRYAYGNQASIARWDLARLAETFLPLFDADRNVAVIVANDVLGGFDVCFQERWLDGMRAKLGIHNAENGDEILVNQLLEWMHTSHQDFTNTFRALSAEDAIREPIFINGDFIQWHGAWSARLARQPLSLGDTAARMRTHNAAVIARNHLVEAALAAAVERQDLTVMERLLTTLAQPYAEGIGAEFTSLPPASGQIYQTFCGT